jgi:hypothetical protein
MTDTQSFDRFAKLIQSKTMELMEYGGTTPHATCELIAEEYPELYKAVGGGRVLKLCEVIHYSEIPKFSERLRERFNKFNDAYFNGELPKYDIRVVNAPNFWGMKPWGQPISGYVDFRMQTIFIGRVRDRFMSNALLHHMIHLATETDDDSQEEFILEAERLKALGAPFGPTVSDHLMPNSPAIRTCAIDPPVNVYAEGKYGIEPPITAMRYFDQAARLKYLRSVVLFMSAGRGRVELCNGLLKLLEGDVVRYGICHPSSRIHQGFGIVSEPSELMNVAEEVDKSRAEPISTQALTDLVRGNMVVLPVFKDGEIDLGWFALDRAGSELLDESFYDSTVLKTRRPKEYLLG